MVESFLLEVCTLQFRMPTIFGAMDVAKVVSYYDVIDNYTFFCYNIIDRSLQSDLEPKGGAMSAIIAAIRHFAREQKWKARHATFGVLIWVLRHQPAEPKSFLAPFFRRMNEAVDTMLAQDAEERRGDMINHIGWEYGEFLGQLQENTVTNAQAAAMADASFQQWLDGKFPELSHEQRQYALEIYRAGKL